MSGSPFAHGNNNNNIYLKSNFHSITRYKFSRQKAQIVSLDEVWLKMFDTYSGCFCNLEVFIW